MSKPQRLNYYHSAYRLPLTAIRLLFTAYCFPPSAYCLLFTAYCLPPSAFCFLLTAYCSLPTASRLLHSAYCLLFTVSLQLKIECCIFPKNEFPPVSLCPFIPTGQPYQELMLQIKNLSIKKKPYQCF